ncbi:hypothetical protein CEXT_106351 [Caerostris extrusa]|uniref:Uncharacterized protein n=1 Tax=Caerostris extrusa TaxID=172846 RepID=A0AAV4VM66_CAEEX|nr:hypothetical protein CEXT_106351 [Caerostris extrusa]
MNTWELSGGIRGQSTFHESQTKNRSQKNKTSGTWASYFLLEIEILLRLCCFKVSLLNMWKVYKILVSNRFLVFLVLRPSGRPSRSATDRGGIYR